MYRYHNIKKGFNLKYIFIYWGVHPPPNPLNIYQLWIIHVLISYGCMMRNIDVIYLATILLSRMVTLILPSNYMVLFYLISFINLYFQCIYILLIFRNVSIYHKPINRVILIIWVILFSQLWNLSEIYSGLIVIHCLS